MLDTHLEAIGKATKIINQKIISETFGKILMIFKIETSLRKTAIGFYYYNANRFPWLITT